MILFTGCSWTYGGELEGIEKDWEFRRDNRFSASFPQSINISKCGISNERIVSNTIDYLEKNTKPDFIVVQFTIMDRYSVANPHAEYGADWLSLQAYQTDPSRRRTPEYVLAKTFLKNFHNPEYAQNEFWRNVCLLENYLDNKDIPYYMMRIDMDQFVQPELPNVYKNACKSKNMFKLCENLLGHVRKKTPPPNPNYCPNLSHIDPNYGGGHPSAEGHKLIANHLQGIVPK
mgnify:FL=1